MKKEGELVSFSPRDRNIEGYLSYNNPSSTVFVEYVPQVESPQPQSQSLTQFIPIGGGDTSLNIARIQNFSRFRDC